MKEKIAIYLAGSIKKGHELAQDSFWTEQEMQTLRSSLQEYEISFLNPAFRSDNLSDQLSVFGRDMLQVYCSHFVLVDARHRRGLGVGAEMMWAKINRIPVVTWAPKDSHYHKTRTTILDVVVDNFVHPFVEALSDKIAETLQDGAAWIQTFMQNPLTPIKDIDHIKHAMQYYTAKQLQHDHPMQTLLDNHTDLKQRVHSHAQQP